MSLGYRIGGVACNGDDGDGDPPANGPYVVSTVIFTPDGEQSLANDPAAAT